MDLSDWTLDYDKDTEASCDPFYSHQEGYPRTPDSSEGLIPRAIICYMGIDPYVLFF